MGVNAVFRKPIEIETRFTPPWVAAIMVWPFILYRPGQKKPRTVSYMYTLWHQCRRCWVLPWVLCYWILGLFYLPRKRWWQHPLQIYAHVATTRVGESVHLAGKKGRSVEVPYRYSRERVRRSGSPAHPGEIVGKTFVKALGFTEEEFAARLDVPPVLLRAIMRGEEAVTVDLALRLERVTRVGADFWLGLQRGWELWQARESEGAAAIESLEPLPLAAQG